MGLLSRAAAQSPAPALVSQWGWGLRVGLGASSSRYQNGSGQDSDYRGLATAMGLGASRYLAGPRLSVALDALLESQEVYIGFRQGPLYPIYSPQVLTQWRLFVPLYLRTGTPAGRLHLLAGIGPTLALGRPGLQPAYYPRGAELTLLLGAEVRVAPWNWHETTLGVRLHAPLTPSYAYGYPASYTSQGVNVTNETRWDVRSPWLGFTLSTTLYPAAR